MFYSFIVFQPDIIAEIFGQIIGHDVNSTDKMNIFNFLSKLATTISNQNMLLFKNEILKDIRELEEKFNSKLSQNNLKNSQRYELYEKKFENLSTRIDQMNSQLADKDNYTEKINNLQLFKEKIEDNINVMNSRLNLFLKEYKGYINNIEQMINDNLIYPGIIGNNAKFLNFRNFIDYILDSFKQFNDFKKEVRNYGFRDFKKEIHSNIQEIKFSISNTNQRFSNLIERNIKEFYSKIDEIIIQNKKALEENENKFNDYKNKINDNLQEYQTKFTVIEKNFNDKYIELLKATENYKNIFIKNSTYIKPNIESNIKNKDNENINDKNNIIKINNNDYTSKKQIIKKEDKNNDDNINLSIADKNYNIYKENDISSNIENPISKRENKIKLPEKSNSFEKKQSIIKLTKNYKINKEKDLRNIHELKNLAVLNDEKLSIKDNKLKKNYSELITKKDKNNNKKFTFKQLNFHKKDIIKNNYSVGTISDLKIKNIVFPDSSNKIIRNQTILLKNSSVIENKNSRNPTNNIIPLSTKNYFISNNNSIFKGQLNNKLMNKLEKEKSEAKKLSETERIIDRKTETKFHKGLNPIKIMKKKLDNFTMNNFAQIKKNKKRSLTSEGGEEKKDEDIQTGFKNDINAINMNKDVLLINTNTYKTNRNKIGRAS